MNDYTPEDAESLLDDLLMYREILPEITIKYLDGIYDDHYNKGKAISVKQWKTLSRIEKQLIAAESCPYCGEPVMTLFELERDIPFHLRCQSEVEDL